MTEKGHAVAPLAAQQRAVLALIIRFHQAAGEAPSVRYIARRLSLHPKTVQQHLNDLCERGWLRTPTPGGVHCLHAPPD